MNLEDVERLLRERLDALGPAPRAELHHVLAMPDYEGQVRIGEFWGNPRTRYFAEPLIDCEEDRFLRAVLVGMLREAALRARPQRKRSCVPAPAGTLGLAPARPRVFV